MKIVKKDIIIFIITFLTAIIIFHPFLLGHYATDTYNIINQGYEKYAIGWNLNDGRIFLAISVLIAEILKLPIEVYVFITLIIAIIISCITIVKLKNIVESIKPAKNLLIEILITAISFITIFNFMYVENLYFVECSMMAASILLYLMSAETLVKRNKDYFLKAMLYAILGIFCYQGTIGFLFAMTALLSCIKNTEKIYKEGIKNLIFSGVIAIIAVILNLIQIKITGNILGTEQTRIKGIESILNNLWIIITHMPNILIYTLQLFPKWILILFTCAIFTITAFELKKEKNLKSIILLFLVIVITIASSFVIFLMTLSSFYSGRMHFCIGALIGIILIFMYAKTKIFEREKSVQYTMIGIVAVYILISIFSQLNVQYEHIKVNKLEKQEIQQIYDYMKDYEKQNNIELTRIISIYIRDNTKAYYNWTTQKCPITYNAVKCSWSFDGIVNFYTGKNLQRAMITSDMRDKCSDFIKDKDKEYECIDNILYMKIYAN